MFDQSTIRQVAAGLKFPEGPIAEADGSILVCEVDGGALVRVGTDGTRTVVSDIGGGGANGAAIGPDGAVYVASSGGFVFGETGEGTVGIVAMVDDYTGGAIHRVDPVTGETELLFTESDGQRLSTLNDVMFDAHGSAYVADTLDGHLHYFDPIARTIRIATSDVVSPNGVGLSPDGTILYVSETYTGRLRAWDVVGPGKLVERPDLYHHAGFGADGWFFDGLAVDGDGNVAVADLTASGIRVISPEGEELGLVEVPAFDPFVTCICFGGTDGRTAYITSGGRGTLYAVDWPWAGGRLAFQR